MKSAIIFTISYAVSLLGFSQMVSTDPEFPTGDEEITITFDLTQAQDSRASGLLGLSSGVYLWSGAGTTENGNAFEYEPEGQTDFEAPFTPGEMTSLGNDLWEITLVPREYFGVPEDLSIVKLGVLLKNGNGSAQTEDVVITLREPNEFQLAINSPQLPAFFDEAESFTIDISTSEEASISISIDDVEVSTGTETTSLVYVATATGAGSHDVEITATDGSETLTEEFTFLVRSDVISEERPAGIVPGINYNQSDPTVATLCLLAPNKTSVYAIGDFSDWSVNSDYQMKQDGDFFWLEVTGLESGVEYAFQYLVDEEVYVADPFCDKILDRFDDEIPEEVYPDLKEYPEAAINTVGLYNTVSVLQTNQAEYEWGDGSYDRPNQSELIIYELLIRDFFGTGEKSYDNLIDTLSYLKSLGVNAIELMPVTEFSRSNSWGYNPNFMFVPERSYGPKDKLKEFIDEAHQLGIAVILDMVLNQQDLPSPLLLMDWDFTSNGPSDSNQYFNNSGSFDNGATHPFSVFYDMNHLSPQTEFFVDTVNRYWIEEYHFDGYRFDLTKGFMQTGSFDNYNQERIDILKRMADEIWAFDPEAYVILEHLGANDEEKELADYGMMLWGKMTDAYKENVLGFENEKTDISSIYHVNRDWEEPHLIGFMESHDEERIVRDAKDFGNETQNYSARENAVNRMPAAFAALLMVPGPKMIWQFGEVGYDLSINYPSDTDNDRTSPKPVPWDDSENYNLFSSPSRNLLRQFVSEMNELRTSYPVFYAGESSLASSSSLIKQFELTTDQSTSSPSNTDQMSAVVVCNFTAASRDVSAQFPFNGTWYSYFRDEEVSVSGGIGSISIPAGDFRILTNVPLDQPELIALSTEFEKSISFVYPNPASDYVRVELSNPLYYSIFTMSGQLLKKGKFSSDDKVVSLNKLNQGVHLIEIITRDGKRHINKLIIE